MRMTTFATSGILFALAMAVGPTIVSAQTTMKCEEQFNMADWDGNGQLSSAELAKIDKTYAQLNKNNDEKLPERLPRLYRWRVSAPQEKPPIAV